LITAAVLGGALAVAMTSAAFELEDRGAGRPGALVDREVATIAPPPASPAGPEEVELRTVVYYIVGSDEEAAALQNARRMDMHYLASQGLPPPPAFAVHFLVYESTEEKLASERLLYEMGLVAPQLGIDLKVVDLTQ
jgi:hypothetical protein